MTIEQQREALRKRLEDILRTVCEMEDIYEEVLKTARKAKLGFFGWWALMRLERNCKNKAKDAYNIMEHGKTLLKKMPEMDMELIKYGENCCVVMEQVLNGKLDEARDILRQADEALEKQRNAG